MADTRYLKKRGEMWHYQRAVPRDIRGGWDGPDPIVAALRTRDLSEAQAQRWPINARYQAMFDALGSGWRPVKMAPAEIEAAALQEFHATREKLAELGVDDETGLAQLAEVQQRKLDLADPSKMHPELGPGTPSRVTDLDYAKIRARLAAIEARRKALAGTVPELPQSFGRRGVDPDTFEPVLPRKRGSGRKSGPRFADVAARFIAERQRDPTTKLTEQTRGQYEAAYRLFDSWANGQSIGDVDRRMAADFLDKIATLDPHWGRSPDTKKRTFEEVFKLYGNQKPGLANKTINRVAMALGIVWRFAEERGEYEGKNPWERQGRTVTKRRGNSETDKRAFRPDEIGKLLAAKPVAAPNKHDNKSALPWVVLIALYSGMRLNEICSLDVGDVKQVGGIWYFDLTASKTEAGVRIVPVHSRILAAGLLDYRARIKGGQLFPSLQPGGPDKKLSWYLSKVFTTYRRSLGIVDLDANGKDRIDLHSTRRAVITALKYARTAEHEVAEIVGHEHERVTYGTYADKQRLAELQRVVEAIRYEGLDG